MEDQSKETHSSMSDKHSKLIDRRRFLKNTGLFLGGGAIFFSAVSALFYNAAVKNKKESKGQRSAPNSLVYLGEKADFDGISGVVQVDYKAEIQDGWVKKQQEGFVYVIKNQQNELLIMSPICTHLGCTVQHAKSSGGEVQTNPAFTCPCHGGQFDQYGINIGGPPPRPLDIYTPVVQEGKVYFEYFSPMKRES